MLPGFFICMLMNAQLVAAELIQHMGLQWL